MRIPKLSLSDILPAMVILVGFIQLFNPSGMLGAWQAAIFSDAPGNKVTVGNLAINFPNDWKYDGNKFVLPSKEEVSVKTSDKGEGSLDRFVQALLSRYPDAVASQRGGGTVIQVSSKRTIVVHEKGDQLILLSSTPEVAEQVLLQVKVSG